MWLLHEIRDQFIGKHCCITIKGFNKKDTRRWPEKDGPLWLFWIESSLEIQKGYEEVHRKKKNYAVNIPSACGKELNVVSGGLNELSRYSACLRL